MLNAQPGKMLKCNVFQGHSGTFCQFDPKVVYYVQVHVTFNLPTV